MKKTKILQFQIKNTKGGVTQYILNNWEYIDRDKFQFDFVTFSKELDFAHQLENEGCKIYYMSCYAEENLELFNQELNNILSRPYDAVHLHTNWWKSFNLEKAATRHRIPKIIVHSHNTMVDVLDEKERAASIERHYKLRNEFNMSMATDLAACSDKARRWLFGENIPEEKVNIINYGINVEKFIFNSNKREQLRKDMQLNDCFIIGHIGRFVYQKNHEFLINMFRQVSSKSEKARLLLIGTGELEENIKKKVEAYGLTDKVIFLGKRDDVSDLMQLMDVFCLPSRFEGFGIVLIEAQAAGLKCICSDAIPAEAKITDNINFLDFNVDYWVDKILKIEKEGYKRKNMYSIITEAGYNNREEIKKLEKLYTLKN